MKRILNKESRAAIELMIANDLITKDVAEKYFPELKESEDERIRKDIIAYIETANQILPQFQKDKWLAWLEKQVEPIDKGEISDGYHTFNELYYYRMLYNAAFFNLLPKEWVHKSKKHHTGEECFGGGWFVVMAELPTGQVSNHYELKDWDLFDIPEREIADEWDGHSPQEAADRLYKYLLERQGEQKPNPVLDIEIPFGAKDSELQEASYHIPEGFHAEIEGNRVVIKKGEQKRADKVEPKFKIGDVIGHKNSDDSYKIIDIINDKYYLCENNHMWDVESQEYFEIKSEQKPAWSEEDKVKINRIVACLENLNVADNDILLGDVNWLKFLKDRVQPQKQEWSEEDEEIYQSIMDDTVQENQLSGKQTDWLRDIKYRYFSQHQNRWKPSERQKEALLWCVVHLGGADKQTLGELLEELNKL